MKATRCQVLQSTGSRQKPFALNPSSSISIFIV